MISAGIFTLMARLVALTPGTKSGRWLNDTKSLLLMGNMLVPQPLQPNNHKAYTAKGNMITRDGAA